MKQNKWIFTYTLHLKIFCIFQQLKYVISLLFYLMGMNAPVIELYLYFCKCLLVSEKNTHNLIWETDQEANKSIYLLIDFWKLKFTFFIFLFFTKIVWNV